MKSSQVVYLIKTKTRPSADIEQMPNEVLSLGTGGIIALLPLITSFTKIAVLTTSLLLEALFATTC